MVKIEHYIINELLDKPIKLKDGKGTAPGSNIYAQRSSLTKKVSKALALKEHRYVAEYVVSLLNQYKKDEHVFNRNHFQTVKKCGDLGIEMEYMRKCIAESITRICFTPEGINSAFQIYHAKGRLKDYNEKNLEQEIRSFIY